MHEAHLKGTLVDAYDHGNWDQLVGVLDKILILAQQRAQIELSMRAQHYIALIAAAASLDMAVTAEMSHLQALVVAGLEHLEWMGRATLSRGEHHL